MDIEVNYKNKKRYKTAKYPIRQPLFFVWLIWLLSRIMLIGKKRKIEKINMEGLKPPYILLSNHMHFIDFELIAMATLPHRVNNVVNIDGYYMRPWLMELIGAICTRKFTRDLHLIKSISRVLKRKDILCMYPEARYTPCGTTSFLPDSLGKLIKLNKVPVVVAIHRGNHLYAPFYNFRQKRKVPHHTTLTQLLTPDDIEKMSAEQINKAIKDAFYYNDYEYILKEGFNIKESYRAEGLHKVLYKCPHCMAEGEMDSKGSEIFCKKCQKRWTVNEDMTLSAKEGETKFSFIPDWYEWERREVEKEILSGRYSFSDTVEVYSLPRCYKWHNLGKATVSHSISDGFVLEGFYRNEKYRIHRTPSQMNSLHIEYDCPYVMPLDCFDISSENDTFYCYPSKENVVTKLAFATEIIHLLNAKNKD